MSRFAPGEFIEVKSSMRYITLLAFLLAFSGIVTAQPGAGSINLFYVISQGNEIDIGCGYGVNSVQPIEVGEERSFTYRVVADDSDDPTTTVTIESVNFENGDQFFITNAPTFPVTLAPGEFVEIVSTFSPQCHGYFSNYLNIRTNDPDQPNCVASYYTRTVQFPGPQLSVLYSAATEEYPFAGFEETNVLPSTYQAHIEAVADGEERKIVLDIINNGLKELDVFDIIWTGPVDPRNDHPVDAVEIGGIIPAGAQRFFWAYLTDEADCDNDEITVEFITNQFGDCDPSYNTESFTIQVDFPDTDCEEELEDDNSGAASLYPTVTNDAITLRLPGAGQTDVRRYGIYHQEGLRVLTGKLPSGVREVKIDVSGLRSGRYYVRLEGMENMLPFVRL